MTFTFGDAVISALLPILIGAVVAIVLSVIRHDS